MSPITQNHISETRDAKGESDLPEGWTSVFLPEVCSINPPKPRADALPSGELVTFVPMPAVDAESGAITRSETRPFSKVRKGFTAFQDGDVIFAKITPCMENGKAAVARNLLNGFGFGSTEFHVIRSNGEVLPEYVYHFIRQESFRKDAEAEMTGSVGQKRVPADFMKQVELPLAPLAEQKRIVAKIEELFTQINAGRARIAKVSQTLKRFRQAVLAAACSGQLTEDWRESHCPDGTASARAQWLREARRELWERFPKGRGKYLEASKVQQEREIEIPKSWVWVTVSQLALQDVGFPFRSREFTDSGVRLLRGENVEPGGLRWLKTEYWSKEKTRGLEHLFVEEGDIILAMDRPVVSTGLKIARAKPCDLPCLLVQRVMRFRMIERETADYLYLRLQHPDFITFLTHSGMTGSDLPHITGTGVAEFPVPLPPLEEQRQIVGRVEALFRLADSIEKSVGKATKRADKLTRAILAKAFRGELVPTEAELARREDRDYEPASVLLESIRAQNQTSQGRISSNRRRKGIDKSKNRS